MATKIIKPASVRYNECIEQVCAVINSYSLPAFVTLNILEKVTAEARRLAETEYQRDMETYQKQIAEQSDTEKE